MRRRHPGSSGRIAGPRRNDHSLVPRGEGLHEEGGLELAARTAARTDTGRVRENNEDRYLVREGGKTTLLAVADGVGGEAGGEMASAAAIDALAASFFAAKPDRPAADTLAAAIRSANDAVLGAAGKSGQQGAASTLVAAAVAGMSAVIGNLGDSRAYLLRDGEIHLVTADHAGESVSSITRFVGDPRGVQPDVFVETLRPGDRLLLCSDGRRERPRRPREIARRRGQHHRRALRGAEELRPRGASTRRGEPHPRASCSGRGRRRGRGADLR
ncbi:MAG: serine/threonine-protein phosphatase [Chloroflexi bacterium]|nr:MAG: serine/threonine-protein phosphatase [Chloroflexota bacterium]